MSDSSTPRKMDERIKEYLCVGGLFNPELMEHDKVRDLIMACREELAAKEKELEKLKRDFEGKEKMLRIAVGEMQNDIDYANESRDAWKQVAERLKEALMDCPPAREEWLNPEAYNTFTSQYKEALSAYNQLLEQEK